MEKGNLEDKLTEKIYDDIHGFVYLTKDEKSLLESPYMQRLHYIRQNGLAYMVFPGANHTRFSHSIGVLFIAEKMIQQLKKTKKIEIKPIDHQVVRLAALLHDIGHYPLSHTIEASYEEFDSINSSYKHPESTQNGNNFKDVLKNERIKISDFFTDNIKPKEEYFHHEQIGKKIITVSLRNKIAKILDSYEKKQDIDYITLIGEIVTGDLSYSSMNDDEKEKYYILSQIIKSDLDADQLDYMCRDTHNTGIEASIRLNFIIDNMNICNKIIRTNPQHKALCFNFKALQSIEQFIISKFYWYTEILFYEKTFVLNLIAQRLNLFMLFQEEGKNYCNKYNSINKFDNLIQNELEYFFFNDMFFWNKIEKIINSEDIQIKEIKKLAEILMNKEIPKLLTKEELCEKLNLTSKDFDYGSRYEKPDIDKKYNFYQKVSDKPKLLAIEVTRNIFKSEKEEVVNYLNDKKINISFCNDVKTCTKICNEKNCKGLDDIGKQTIIELFIEKDKIETKSKNIIKDMVFDFEKIL